MHLNLLLLLLRFLKPAIRLSFFRALGVRESSYILFTSHTTTVPDKNFIFIYTWFFENMVSKDKDSFYYLAIKNNKIRPKADWTMISLNL